MRGDFLLAAVDRGDGGRWGRRSVVTIRVHIFPRSLPCPLSRLSSVDYLQCYADRNSEEKPVCSQHIWRISCLAVQRRSHAASSFPLVPSSLSPALSLSLPFLSLRVANWRLVRFVFMHQKGSQRPSDTVVEVAPAGLALERGPSGLPQTCPASGCQPTPPISLTPQPAPMLGLPSEPDRRHPHHPHPPSSGPPIS